MPHTVVFVRHGQSKWNLENKFTGWVDVPLTEKGIGEAKEAGVSLREAGFNFDVAFTSVLKRAIGTCHIILEEMDLLWIPEHKDYHLNERMYGALAGLNKKETAEKHGKEQVHIWRRSYDVPPPEASEDHEFYPGKHPAYANVPKEEIPTTESLKLTLERVLPYWQNTIVPAIKSGKKVLIAAHGNSIRAIVKYLDNIPEDKITGVDIPTGVPLVYTLDDDMKPLPQEGAAAPLAGKYLVDEAALKAKVDEVKNQAGGK